MNTTTTDDNPVDIRPFAYAISLINGKWKMHILFWIWHEKVLRYNELKRRLGNVSHKMLSNQLKELETDGVIFRNEYPQVPPKVEYTLTELGISLMPVLDSLCDWGHKHVPDAWELS
ncbi:MULTISPECIES: winged helix-turn-helix transcriptional regulator [Anaerotignum]|uniref:winged helix-turn-helix transcriptional regulator n=1 Tax=Anaerotignum TaxID=2039240 RepID=UPI00210924DF|nr:MULTISPECIES: helix-turn-helix domain-containing protein [Anaerotignum]MCQ4937000.1 helix-turn-helix transcriptional regulator [Anaerotignum propionicum]